MVNLRPGAVLRIPEGHYCYGTGELVLRVTVVDPNPHPGLEWLRVQGVEVRWDGSDGDRRDVLVRVAALPAAISHP
jgi:hypothetical protein